MRQSVHAFNDPARAPGLCHPATPRLAENAAVTVTPSRRLVDQRDPSVSFTIVAPAHTSFDVLLATDPTLFSAQEAHRRTDKNFRSSRQDFDGESIPMEIGLYMTPTVFLREVAGTQPMPERLYYVAVAYKGQDIRNGVFSTPTEILTTNTPSVQLSPGLASASLSTVLGVAVERLGQVGARSRVSRPLNTPSVLPPQVGGLPIAHYRNGRSSPGRTDDLRSLEPVPPANAGSQRPQNHVLPVNNVIAANGSRSANGGNLNNSIAGGAGDGALPPNSQEEPMGTFIDEDVAFGPKGANGNGLTDVSVPDYQDGFEDEVPAAPPEEMNKGSASVPIPPLDEGPEPRATGQAFGDLSYASGADNGTPPTDNAISAVRNDVRAPGIDAQHAIIDVVAGLGSAGRYDAMNLDREFRGGFGESNPYFTRAHAGLGFGLLPFNQDSGLLGALLTQMQAKDAELFGQVFGNAAQDLLAVTNATGPNSLESPGGRSARVQPVEGADLWEEPWVSRFRAAADYPAFRESQRDILIDRFLRPMLPFADNLGIAADRGIAMLYDRAAQQGVDAAARFVMAAAGSIDTPAKRSAALDALGHATLEEFQQANNTTVDGQWDAESHAAVTGALRALGAASPIQIPGYFETLDAIVMAAATQPFAQRVLAVRNANLFTDSAYTMSAQ